MWSFWRLRNPRVYDKVGAAPLAWGSLQRGPWPFEHLWSVVFPPVMRKFPCFCQEWASLEFISLGWASWDSYSLPVREGFWISCYWQEQTWQIFSLKRGEILEEERLSRATLIYTLRLEQFSAHKHTPPRPPQGFSSLPLTLSIRCHQIPTPTRSHSHQLTCGPTGRHWGFLKLWHWQSLSHTIQQGKETSIC